MSAIHRIKESISHRIQANADSGLYYFRFRGPTLFSDKKIVPAKLALHRYLLSRYAAEQVLKTSTQGAVGRIDDGDVHWLKEIGKYLSTQGVELPVTEVDEYGQYQWGTPFEKYTHPSVTAVVSVNTNGEQIMDLRNIMMRNGLVVNRAVAIVERNPDPNGFIDQVPIIPVLKVPFPLETDIEMFSEFRRMMAEKIANPYESVERLLG